MTLRPQSADRGVEVRLEALVREAWRQALITGHPVVASLVEPSPPLDPLAVFARLPAGLARVLWKGAEGRVLVGLGDALVLTQSHPPADSYLSGDHTVSPAWMARVWRSLTARALVVAPADVAHSAGPLLIGGFAFDPLQPRVPVWQDFPAARLCLPRLLLLGERDRWWVVSTLLVQPGTDLPSQLEDVQRLRSLLAVSGATSHTPGIPATGAKRLTAGRRELCDLDCWRAMVEQAIERIRHGDLLKVVLARAVEVTCWGSIDVERVLRSLDAGYPACTLFAFHAGDAVFLGATPERLIRLHRRRVETIALAGSTRRGTTPEEDAALAGTLLASAKDRREHAVVVDEIRAALAPLCHALVIPEEPSLLSVRNVHHLATPISGELAGDHTVLELVERLHPTPAVGGAPRANALAFIRAHEPVDRGWYAGPVGWVDCAGEGEFAVALRSGLIRGRTAHLYAGCGILADSDPEAEYAESELKLQPLLRALEGA